MTDSRDHRRSRVVTVIVPGLITRSLGRGSAATERGSTGLERPVVWMPASCTGAVEEQSDPDLRDTPVHMVPIWRDRSHRP